MTKKRKRIIGIVIGIVVLLPILQVTAVILIENYQHRKNAVLVASLPLPEYHSKTLVVYFSRSGNTEVMAYTIADSRKAKLLNLVAADYEIGFGGWVNAMADAWKMTATIQPQQVDLSAYDTVYIGLPVWLYSPAPPVFEFVSKNDFAGKKVVLFNSMNSKFEQQYIDKFSHLVQQKGGTLIQHICINRGRMPRQLSTPAFIDSIKAAMLN